MGSVIDNIECPNCKQEAFSDFYYKSGDEYINCNNCGYHYSATIINRDKKLNELTDDDWEIKELKNPYGSYRISCYDSIGFSCGALENEEQANELKAICEQDDTIEYLQISRFVDDEIKVEMLVDNGPKVDSQGFTQNI
jgi:Zn ribbon nucleic-acid-binding protein